MKLYIEFQAELAVLQTSTAIAMIEAEGPIELTFAVEPGLETETLVDIYGNRFRRLAAPAGTVNIEYRAVVNTRAAEGVTQVHLPEPAGLDLMTAPPDVLHFTLPSRYCPSDEFARVAEDTFGTSRPAALRVEDISRWINERIQNGYGTSNVSTSARDTFVHRAGVCRDFAHMGITFCRALNIPARYVSGYCLDLKPQDLHAYFQAFIDGDWVTFDATSPQPRSALAHIAVGRDAADCAWWTSFGQCATNRMSVNVTEAE